MAREDGRHLVVVVGAGPAGLYSSARLMREGVRVILLNRDVKYGGLAEYGIFPTKYRMKEGLRAQFRKVLADPLMSYRGNVMVGREGDVTLDDIRSLHPSAVLITAGAQGTKTIGVEGDDAEGVYHAKDLVFFYNDLPLMADRRFSFGNRVAIIGVGNVMVDIAHFLIQMKKTPEVIAVARRGPGEIKYSPREIRYIASCMDVEAIRAEIERIRDHLVEVGQKPEELLARILAEREKAKPLDSPTRFSFRFLCQPRRVIADGDHHVTGLEVEHTRLEKREGRGLAARGLGTTEVIPVDNVVFAVGDVVDMNLGLPHDDWEYIKNPSEDPEFPGAHEYEAYDPQTKQVLRGVFVAGWSRKASDGLVGVAKMDGEKSTGYILLYLGGIEPLSGTEIAERVDRLDAMLERKGVDPVSAKDILRLEEAEKAEAKRLGLEAFKWSTNDEMLRIIRDRREQR